MSTTSTPWSVSRTGSMRVAGGFAARSGGLGGGLASKDDDGERGEQKESELHPNLQDVGNAPRQVIGGAAPGNSTAAPGHSGRRPAQEPASCLPAGPGG